MSAPLFFMAPGAPTPVAPFSHAVEVDGWCFITGQMPTWPDDDSKPLPPDIEGQTKRVMENLKIVLGGLKLGLGHVICARVYITDFETNYPRMNAVYASYFPADRRPARTCIGVTGLACGAMVEIDLLANADVAEEPMCRGDDPSCSEFELHHRQFIEDMARERRAFLGSRFAANGGAATLTAGGLALPKRISPATRHHHLPANADTVHWGYFSKNLKPQLEVESGDFVTIETLTHQASDDHERMIEGDPGAESVYLWTRDKKGVPRRGAGEGDGKGLGVHICTGPVLVQGAEPGDVLEVRIVDVILRPSANPKFRGLAFGSNAAANWGFHYNDFLTGGKREVVTIYELDATGERNWARAVYNFRWPEVTDPFGVKHPTIDYPGLPVDHALTARHWDVLKGVRVPVRPHFGVMGLAPKEADDVNSVPPSYTGGNIDNWRIGKGASAYYPVAVPGALLSVGDPHASQGDSELCGTAIECSLTGTFQLILHKASTLAGTPIEGLDFPLIETQAEWVLQGFSFPNYLADLGTAAQSEIFRKSSVDLAMRDAFRKMRRFLMTAKNLTEDEAISLMSIAVDFGITQVVDGNWGVHAIVRKDIFPA